MSLGSDGLVNGVYWGPEPNTPATLLSPATEHVLLAASAALRMFGLGQPSEFTDLFRRAEKMFEEFTAEK